MMMMGSKVCVLLVLVPALCTICQAQTPQPYGFQPEELRSVDGKLEVTFNVSYAWSLNNTRYSAVYNGMPVGPTLRVKPGDELIVTLNNQLPPAPAVDRELWEYVHDPMNDAVDFANVTIIYNRLSAIGNIYEPEFGFFGLNFQNIHFHGAGFPVHEEDLQNPVDGGETRVYRYTIRDDHPPGLVWYHSHVHGNAASEFMSGEFGMMVIEGTSNDITTVPEIEQATEVFLLMSEFFGNPETSKPAPFLPIVMAFNWKSVVNGHLAEEVVFTFTQGETVLFRTVNAGVEPPVQLFWLDGNGPQFLAVAEDGFPVPSLKYTDRLSVEAGSRMEFMVKFDTPGVFELRRAAWTGFEGTPNAIRGRENCLAGFGIDAERCVSYDVEQLVATIVVEQADTPINAELPTEVPDYDDYYRDLYDTPIVGTKDIVLKQKVGFPLFQIPYDGPFVPPAVAFGINDLLVTPTRRQGAVEAGTCEEWMIISDPPALGHPFHSHTVPFLLTHVDGVELEKPLLRDSYAVEGNNATIKICATRLQPGDFMYIHCHMPSHSDIGMAAYYSVIPQQVDPSPAPVTEMPSAGFSLPITQEPTEAPTYFSLCTRTPPCIGFLGITGISLIKMENGECQNQCIVSWFLQRYRLSHGWVCGVCDE